MTDTLKRNIFLGFIAVVGLLFVVCGAILTGIIDVSGFQRKLSTDKHPAEDTDLIFANATLRYQDSDFFMARTMARRILYIDPQHIGARKLLAAVALREKDYATAEQQCKEALRINPTDMTAQVGLGMSMRAQGKNTEAASAFKRVLDNTGDDEESKDKRREANVQILQMQKELEELAAKDAKASAELKSVNTVLNNGGALPTPSPTPNEPFGTPTPSPMPGMPTWEPMQPPSQSPSDKGTTPGSSQIPGEKP
jgi:tetratricopeptide (TPR) repeat protein